MHGASLRRPALLGLGNRSKRIGLELRQTSIEQAGTTRRFRERLAGPLKHEVRAGTARWPAIGIFARAEIVVPVPSYAKISGPDAGAKSGAGPDDHCRHRQAYGK